MAMGDLMKLFSLVGTAALALFLAVGMSPSAPDHAAPSVQQDAVADTFACPQLSEIDAYLQAGFGEDTQNCSLISWKTIAQAVSLGERPAYYQEWSDEDESAPATVEVFEVEIDSLRLYAVRDPVIDEHYLDPDLVGAADAIRFGLQPRIAYELWDSGTAHT